MKKISAALFLFICCLTLIPNAIKAQGTWTWMSGDTLNNTAVFGKIGVPDSTSYPYGAYEVPCWTDKQGNFWLYDSGLWKFNPAIDEWALIRKEGHEPVFGTKGIASPTNTPGDRQQGILTWTDTTGNLWLLGGNSPITNWRPYCDLWMYSIATGEWTWMNGSVKISDPGVYGTKGTASPTNYPAGRFETTASWVDDSTNTLWFFGGFSDSSSYSLTFNDVWQYNISTNEWTWENGSQSLGIAPAVGTLKQESATNTPGGRDAYCHWSDAAGNFWIFGGGIFLYPYFNDVWKYNRHTNQWACMMQNTGFSSNPASTCLFSASAQPATEFENRGCWTDACGKFWTFSTRGEMWEFDPATIEWSMVSASKGYNYGRKKVTSASSYPRAVTGAPNWMDKQGNFWMLETLYNSALMKYTPDASCGGCIRVSVQAAFSINDTLICPGNCITFSNSSVNATGYQWSFPGGSPNTSSAQSPPHICYAQAGVYAAQLIATGGGKSDTLRRQSYITVNPAPLAGTITLQPDTLCQGSSAMLTDKGSQGAIEWQSSINAGSFTTIPAATSSVYHSPPSLGQTTDYRVIATNGLCGNDTSGAVTLYVVPEPVAKFTYSINGSQVSFNADSSSANVTSYHWDFGDGSTSDNKNPVHSFSNKDTFYVCLTVYNNTSCFSTYCQNVNLVATGAENVSGPPSIHLYPNPANNTITLSTEGLMGNYRLKIYNVLGQQVWQQAVNLFVQQTIPVNLTSFAPGTYELALVSDKEYYSKRFMKVQ